MAKPNYSFEKRQRELAKKIKKENKAADRAARKAAGDGGEVQPFSPEADVPTTTTAPDPSDPAAGTPPVPAVR